MSKVIVKKDEHKVLRNNITPEFFKNDPYMAVRFKIVIREMLDYTRNCSYIISGLEKNYSSLSKKHLDKLPFNYKERIEKVKKGIELNQMFYNKVASLYALEFDHLSYTKEEHEEHRYFEEYLIRGFFMSCLMRDWTLESKPERDNNYGNVLKEVKKYYNYDDKNLMKNNNYKALVPGTGCSRMAFELAKRGFEVEANDFCFIYILCDDYLFNYSHKNEFQFCPSIHTFANNYSESSVIKRYSFPDVDIRDELEKSGAKPITFIKGDFLLKYKGIKDQYDLIVTLFFIDVSKNIIEYVEIMHDLLKKGGVWVNLGCLDYFHSKNLNSIDLTWDELRQVIINYDFDIKNEVTEFVPYGVKIGSTVSDSYGTVFFTAVKK
jgi:carnosine N-methyltransferase